MHLLDALTRFTNHIPRTEEFCRDVCELSLTNADGSVDYWPEAMIAAVSLAGMLDDAETDADLVEGARHFQTLFNAGVFGLDEFQEETARIMHAVVEEVDAMAAREGMSREELIQRVNQL